MAVTAVARDGGQGGSELRSVGAHFVIAPADADDGPLAAALAGLRPAPDALLVLAAAADAAPVLRGSLVRLAGLARERGAPALTLAASGLAAPAPDGRRPAEAFARTAGLPVIAPDGLVSVEPDGGLRVTVPGAATPGSWWLIDPAGEPKDLGPSWPARPEAESRAEAAAEVEEAEAEEAEEPEAAGPVCPEADPIGQGFWLTAPGRPDRALGLAAADSGTLLLVVGSPREPDLPAAELLRRVAGLAPAPAELLLSAPWAGPAALAEMAAGLAGHFGRDVRAAVGLPVRGADHCTTTYLDTEGRPTWEPVIAELTASAALGRVLASGWHGLPPMPPAGPAVFRAWDGWELEAVPAGLWLRPEAAPQDAGPRMRPAAYHRPHLIVGEPGRELTGEVWDRLDEVLAALPALGGEPFGLVLAGSGDEDAEAVGRFLCRRHAVEWIGAEPSTGSPDPTAAADPVPVPAAPEPERAPEGASEPEPEPVSVPAASRPQRVTQPVPEPLRPAPGPAPAPSPSPSPSPSASPSACVSGERDRDGMKALLGKRYHLLASKAEMAAVKLPGLRSSQRDDLKPDLVAVLLHQADGGDPATRAELAAAARAGASGPLTPYLRCLASGLRRLPSHHGAVLVGASARPAGLGDHRPGSLVAEPAPVCGVLAQDAELGAPVEFGIWSTTGRRTAAFASAEAEPEVVFAPGTRYSVLAVLPGDEGTGVPDRVLLREVSTAEAEATATVPDGGVAGPRDRQARERLTAWFEARDRIAPSDRRAVEAERFHLEAGVAAFG
ncbi:hypothetical protein ACODT3_04325 [Streptomyces sp. 4.24]|uniref:hypothetical protein n=1 Tax=Streptomyces tritrimontium TaxID=3406573 RepID=UPI003BB75EEE